jgi:hypothetical protein
MVACPKMQVQKTQTPDSLWMLRDKMSYTMRNKPVPQPCTKRGQESYQNRTWGGQGGKWGTQPEDRDIVKAKFRMRPR